ncbi:proQ/FINO family protein [Escherichia coli]|nr:proQ/FINO family protein [Escherichia coli]
MTKLTINRKPKGIYGTPQKTTQAAQQQDKTTSAHKVMPGNQKAQQKPTGATPWRHMTKRQRKNRRRVNRLTELWPELFSREAPKPLKVGIFDDLKCQPCGEVTPQEQQDAETRLVALNEKRKRQRRAAKEKTGA